MHTMFTCNSLSAANSFFLSFFFSFCLSNIPTTIRRGSASYWIISLSLSLPHTYAYICKPELTLYDVSWSSGLFYKEYGSFVGKLLGGVV